MMSTIFNWGLSWMQGGPLEHVIAAKAVAFVNIIFSSKHMPSKLKKNAQRYGKLLLVNKGYGIISGGTDNHLMLIDLRTKFPILNADRQKML